MAIPLFTGERTEKESELLDKRYKQVIDALQKAAPEGAIIPEKIQAAREKERALRESDGALAPAGLLDPIEFLPDVMGVGAIGAALGSMAIKKQAQRAAPSAAGFTSKLEDVVRQKMGGKATAEEIGAMVKQAGVKQEEIEDIGLEKWLSEQPSSSKIQKESVLDFITKERPELKQTRLGRTKEDEIKFQNLKEDFELARDRANKERENFVVFIEEAAKKFTEESRKPLVEELAERIGKNHPYLHAGSEKTVAERHINYLASNDDNWVSMSWNFLKNEGLTSDEILNLQQAAKYVKVDDPKSLTGVSTLSPRGFVSYILQNIDNPELSKSPFLKKLGISEKEFSEKLQSYRNAAQEMRAKDDAFVKSEVNLNRPTKWREYSLSRPKSEIGENYRELVFSFTPKDSQKKSFATAHWANIKNPVYHIRAQDLVDSQGSKLLNVDEIQSDLHQLGQRLGYKKRDLSDEERFLITDLLNNHGFVDSEVFSDEDLIKYSLYLGDEDFKKVIPILKEAGIAVDLPFKKSWHEQGMRRMIREAVESGKDGLSWTAGSVQAKRAGQGLEEIESITYDPSSNFLEAVRQGESEPIAFEAGLQELNRYVGSENAKKIKAAVAIKKQERAKWIERQQKQDDYALEKFRAWFRPELERQRGPVSDEVFERFYKYAVETIKDGDVNNPYRIQLKEQLSNAGLTPIQISDLINKRIKNPPSLDVEIPVEGGSFGGEGMKKFYDEKLLNFMRDEAKRLGGTISQTTVIGKDGIEYPLWKFTFGPKTKDLLQEKGMPLYQVPTAVGLGELMRQYKQQQEQSNER